MKRSTLGVGNFGISSCRTAFGGVHDDYHRVLGTLGFPTRSLSNEEISQHTLIAFPKASGTHITCFWGPKGFLYSGWKNWLSIRVQLPRRSPLQAPTPARVPLSAVSYGSGALRRRRCKRDVNSVDPLTSILSSDDGGHRELQTKKTMLRRERIKSKPVEMFHPYN